MDTTTLVISLLVGVIVLGVIAEILFQKFKIPEQIVLLLFGVIIQFSNLIPDKAATLPILNSVAPIMGTVVLSLIILDAGLEMKAYDMLVRSPKVLALSALEPVVSGLGFSAIMYFAFGWPPLYGAIFGVLFGTTTGEVVVPLLRSVRVDEVTQDTLILNCVYNSVTAIVAFQILFPVATSSSLNIGSIISGAVLSFLVGIIVGVLSGFVWALLALKRISKHQYLITIGAAFAVYLASEILGGNGLLSILLFAIVIGNYNNRYRRLLSSSLYGIMLGRLGDELQKVLKISNERMVENLRNAQKEITFILKVFFFVYLGLLFRYDGSYLVAGILLSFALLGFKYLDLKALKVKGNLRLMSLIGPRGITPIILAETFYVSATSSSAPSFAQTIAGPMLSMTFIIIFATIIIAVVSSVIFSGGTSISEEEKKALKEGEERVA